MTPRLRYYGPAGDDATPRSSGVKVSAYSANFGEVVPVSTVGGPVTITLPPAVMVGEVAVRLVAGTSAVTVDGFGSDTIDGAATATIDLTGDGRILACNGLGAWTTVTSAPSTAILSAWVAAEVAAQFALLDGYMPMPMVVNTQTSVSGTYAIPDMDVAQLHDLTLTGNVTFTFPANPPGKQFLLVLRQDAVGGHIITWPANMRYPQGAFNLTTTAGGTDLVRIIAVRPTHWGATLEGKAFFP